MAQAFSKTTRSLAGDRGFHFVVVAAIAVLFTAVWGVWFFTAEIGVLVATNDARLEVNRSVHVVQAPVAGRVKTTEIQLGRAVAAGDVLLELDPRELEDELRTLEARLESLPKERDALDAAIVAERAGLDGTGSTNRSGEAGARARLRRAEIATESARSEHARLSQLGAKGVVSRGEVEAAFARLQEAQATESSLRSGVGEQRAQGQRSSSDREADIAHLERERAKLDGEIATLKATAQSMRNRVADHVLRAPVAGQVGDVTELRPGAYVERGQTVASIVPEGTVRVVAWLAANEAIGRVRKGQAAVMRLDGFPWTQYGALDATVDQVAQEPQKGRIRVDLQVRAESAGAEEMLAHGLPGRLEIEVEHVSPATLVLRSAGRMVSAERAP